MERFFGCHVSASGGLEKALEAGDALGINTIQIHSAPPQRWNSRPAAAGAEKIFLETLPKSKVKKVFFHGIYLINLASADEKNLKLSKLSLINSMELLHRVKGEAMVFHCGSLKELDEETGYKQAAQAIDEAMSESPGSGKLLLEVSAGGGKVVGAKMEELARIYEMIRHKERVGFGLDTQHMWASGYNWREELERIVEDIDRIFGLDRVGLIHLNDSMTEYSSRKDRHQNLGDGLIGEDALRSVFLHPKLAKIPFVLETPAMKVPEMAKGEVDKLHRWLGN